MGDLTIKHGYDLLLAGAAVGPVQPLVVPGETTPFRPDHLVLDTSSFSGLKFRLLSSVGDRVRRGQPLVEDRLCPGRMFCSPAGGTIVELCRGAKRRLLAIVIQVESEEEHVQYPLMDPDKASRGEIVARLLEGGVFPSIFQRPFGRIADPTRTPRGIFVQGLRSAPLSLPPEFEVEPHQECFRVGLKALKRLTEGPVFVVHRPGSPFAAWGGGGLVELRSVAGPHPSGNASMHIEAFLPVQGADDCIWTLEARTVVAIGMLLAHGVPLNERVVSVAGPGLLPGTAGFFRVRDGFPIAPLLQGRLQNMPVRIIAGDPLSGVEVSSYDFLRFHDAACTVLKRDTSREFLHFLRLGAHRPTLGRGYGSGFLSPSRGEERWTTHQHGEPRPIIDGALYDRYMPLEISTAALIRSLLAKEDERAVELGLLSVVPEDFALAAVACPSKIDLPGIVRDGIERISEEQK